jgi:endonuclease/exonuclease/phosphatase family metal-dependent hydrolase
MYVATLALASILAAATVATPVDGGGQPATALQSVDISVLTYNVRGLPWPVATGRASALREIGHELAEMRQQGRQPDVVLIQEGFRSEVADLVRASGYRYWAQGPARSERDYGAAPQDGHGYRRVRYPSFGEGWGKFTGAGLHVLSDAPITDVQAAPYRYCAGLDCLANKGVMLARLAPPGVPAEIDVVNTHMNSKRASHTPLARSLQAHNLQTEELVAFINARRSHDAPLLVGGDFNVKGAPDRYDFGAAARPYKVVSEFCNDPAAACEGQAPAARAAPWLRSQDLQAFTGGGAVDVRPVRVETVFAGGPAGRLSDHDGYLVRYRLSWTPGAVAAARPRSPVAVRPQLKSAWGVKVAWTY